MSTEQRVWLHWKALKRSQARNGRNTNSNAVWLTLARVHKMKVRQIKDIIATRRGGTAA